MLVQHRDALEHCSLRCFFPSSISDMSHPAIAPTLYPQPVGSPHLQVSFLGEHGQGCSWSFTFHRVPDPWEIPAGCPKVSPLSLPLSLFSSPLPPVLIQIAPGQIQLHVEEEEGPATQVSSDLTSLSFPSPVLVFCLWRRGCSGRCWVMFGPSRTTSATS